MRDINLVRLIIILDLFLHLFELTKSIIVSKLSDISFLKLLLLHPYTIMFVVKLQKTVGLMK